MTILGSCHRCGTTLFHDSRFVRGTQLLCLPCFEDLRDEEEKPEDPPTQRANLDELMEKVEAKRRANLDELYRDFPWGLLYSPSSAEPTRRPA